MSPRLSFGERVARLEREFQARGKTQADLADSLGVSTRTVQRWKGREDPPEGAGSKLYQEVGGSRENILRRRERYYYRYSPVETEPVSDPPPIERRSVHLSDEDLGLLDRPAFIFPTPREALRENPRLREAVEDGRKITLHLRSTEITREPGQDQLLSRTIHLPEDPTASRESFVSFSFRFAREIMDVEGGSDVTIEIVSVGAGGG